MKIEESLQRRAIAATIEFFENNGYTDVEDVNGYVLGQNTAGVVCYKVGAGSIKSLTEVDENPVKFDDDELRNEMPAAASDYMFANGFVEFGTITIGVIGKPATKGANANANGYLRKEKVGSAYIYAS